MPSAMAEGDESFPHICMSSVATGFRRRANGFTCTGTVTECDSR